MLGYLIVLMSCIKSMRGNIMEDNQKTIILNKDSCDDFIDFSNPYDIDVLIKVLNEMMKE